MTMCRAFSKPDAASDHKLIMAGIRIKMKTVRREVLGRRFDVERLKEESVKKQYSTSIWNRWRQVNLENVNIAEEAWSS